MRLHAASPGSRATTAASGSNTASTRMQVVGLAGGAPAVAAAPAAGMNRRLDTAHRQPSAAPATRRLRVSASNAPEGATTVLERPVGPAILCHLSLPHKCNAGEVIKLVGNHPIMGSWDAAKAPSLILNGEDNWTAELALPPGVYEFKAVVYNEETDTAKWELIQSRTMEVPTVPGTLRVKCAWGSNNMHLAFQPAGEASNGVAANGNGNGAAQANGNGSKAPPAPTPKRAAPAPPDGAVRVKYTDELKDWVAFEGQVLGLLSNFSALPLDRLHSVLGFTMVETKFTKSVGELEAFIDLLISQGFVTTNEKGWYTIQSTPAPVAPTERPPTPPRKRLEVVKPTPRPAAPKPITVVNKPAYMPAPKPAAPAPAPAAPKPAPAPAPVAPKPATVQAAAPAPAPAPPKPAAAAPAPAPPKPAPVAAKPAPAPPKPAPVAAKPAPAPAPVAAKPAPAPAPAAPAPAAAPVSRSRARSPVPVTARVPTPKPSGATYPANLKGWNVFETQTLGLVSNFQSISLERLHSVMRLTMVNPRFDKSQEELGTFLDFLTAEGLISVDAQGWYAYVQDREPSPAPPAPKPPAARARSVEASTVAPAAPKAASPAPAAVAAASPSAVRAASPSSGRATSPRAGSPRPRPDPALSLPVSQLPKDVPIWWPAAEIDTYREGRSTGIIPPTPVPPPPATPRPPNMSEEQTAALAENAVVAVGVVALASLLIANVTHQVTVNPKYVGGGSSPVDASLKK